jgi:hypothetical protein
MTTMMRQPKGRLETMTLRELLSAQYPEREDLVGPWLRQGESAMIWAAPATGKTLLTLTIGLMVAGGGCTLGWNSPKPRRVLLVDGEMAKEDLQERARWLMDTIDDIDREAAMDNLTILARSRQEADVEFPDLNDRERRKGHTCGQDVVFEMAQRERAELVLLDNFSTLSEVMDENDAAAMTPTLRFLLRFKQARIACVLVHHSNKTGETFRGSSKLATTFEVIIGLMKPNGAPEAEGAVFLTEWTKYRRKRCPAVQPRKVKLEQNAEGRIRWITEETEDSLLWKLVESVKSCRYKTARDAGAACGLEEYEVSRLKARAVSSQKITEIEWKACLKAAREMDTEMTEDF